MTKQIICNQWSIWNSQRTYFKKTCVLQWSTDFYFSFL